MSGMQGGPALSILRSVLDWVVPPTCLACGADTGQAGLLCVACFQSLHVVTVGCSRCALPLDTQAYVGEDGLCGACRSGSPGYPWHRARSAFLYEGAARTLILQMKYADRPDRAAFLVRTMLEVGHALCMAADIVLPVPLHYRRLWSRRYNQAAVLSGRIAHFMPHLHHIPDALIRKHPTPALAELDPDSRRQSMQGAIAVASRHRAALVGRRVLLVDDILTTGATAAICASCLYRAGAVQVDVLTVARTVALATAPLGRHERENAF